MARLLLVAAFSAAVEVPVVPDDCDRPFEEQHLCSCFQLLNLQQYLDRGQVVDHIDVVGGVRLGLQLWDRSRLGIQRAAQAHHALLRCHDALLDPWWRSVYMRRAMHAGRLQDDFGGPASGIFLQEANQIEMTGPSDDDQYTHFYGLYNFERLFKGRKLYLNANGSMVYYEDREARWKIRREHQPNFWDAPSHYQLDSSDVHPPEGLWESPGPEEVIVTSGGRGPNGGGTWYQTKDRFDFGMANGKYVRRSASLFVRQLEYKGERNRAFMYFDEFWKLSIEGDAAGWDFLWKDGETFATTDDAVMTWYHPDGQGDSVTVQAFRQNVTVKRAVNVQNVIFLDASRLMSIYMLNLGRYVIESLRTLWQRLPTSLHFVRQQYVDIVPREHAPDNTDVVFCEGRGVDICKQPDLLVAHVVSTDPVNWNNRGDGTKISHYMPAMLPDRQSRHEVYVMVAGCDYDLTTDGPIATPLANLTEMTLKMPNVRFNVLFMGGTEVNVLGGEDCQQWWRDLSAASHGFFRHVPVVPEDPSMIPDVVPMQEFMNYALSSHAFRETFAFPNPPIETL